MLFILIYTIVGSSIAEFDKRSKYYFSLKLYITLVTNFSIAIEILEFRII